MDSGARGSGMGFGIGRDRGPICLGLALRSRVAFCGDEKKASKQNARLGPRARFRLAALR